MASVTIGGREYQVHRVKLKDQAALDAALATLPEPPAGPSRARAEAMRAAIVEAGEAAVKALSAAGRPELAEASEANLRRSLVQAAAEQMAISLDRIPDWPPKLALGGGAYLAGSEAGQKLLLKCALGGKGGIPDDRLDAEVDALYDDIGMDEFYAVLDLFMNGEKPPPRPEGGEEEGGPPKGGGAPGASSTGTTSTTPSPTPTAGP